MNETLEALEAAMKRAAHPDQTIWLKWVAAAEYSLGAY